jgi:hypothetical protein
MDQINSRRSEFLTQTHFVFLISRSSFRAWEDKKVIIMNQQNSKNLRGVYIIFDGNFIQILLKLKRIIRPFIMYEALNTGRITLLFYTVSASFFFQKLDFKDEFSNIYKESHLNLHIDD